MTVYVGKQYEIITLIVIRRLFKDLSKLELSANWFESKSDLQFTYDLVAALALFFLIYLFNRYNLKNEKLGKRPRQGDNRLSFFIKMKQIIASALVPIFLGLAIYSFGTWAYESFFAPNHQVHALSDINDIFFHEFFTILILTDVLLLLLSLYHTDKFSSVFRNSGFIITTILIRQSFSTEGLLSSLLIIVAVLFGVLILGIHYLYEKMDRSKHRVATINETT